MPYQILQKWLEQEQQLGSPNPFNMVLASATLDHIPHNRVVAIREMNETGILFFTQRGTRKFQELTSNPIAAATIWLPLLQRQVICEGDVEFLNSPQNQAYWESLPRERQLRFASYAPTSGLPINNMDILENNYQKLNELYSETAIPMSEYYCGIRLVPQKFYFYTLGKESFSEVFAYYRQADAWQKQLLSP